MEGYNLGLEKKYDHEKSSNIYKTVELVKKMDSKAYFFCITHVLWLKICDSVHLKLNEKFFKIIEVLFCFGTPFLKMILNESQTIWLYLIIY